MAAIDYAGILAAVTTLIETNAPTVRVLEEADSFAGAEAGQAVIVFMVERSAPLELQRLEAGRSTHMHLVLSLMCLSFSLVSTRQAKMDALELAGNVERWLLSDRSLGGKVRNFTIDGGLIHGSPGQSGSFVGMVEVRLTCHVVSRL